jgi:hypothetical protein
LPWWAVVPGETAVRRLRPITCTARSKTCPRTSQAEVARIVLRRAAVDPRVGVEVPGAQAAPATVRPGPAGTVRPLAVAGVPVVARALAVARVPVVVPPRAGTAEMREPLTPVSVAAHGWRRRSPSCPSLGSPTA